MGSRDRPKKVLYLSPPAPDRALRHRSVTRIIPPQFEEPPPPPPPICEPEPEPELLPPPPPPPEPEDISIEVISVDVEPSPRRKKPKPRRSRSKSSRRSSSHDREVLIERDHYIPYPVRVEQEYDTYRYVEAPVRYVSAPPERMITQGEDERIHIDITDRRRTREYGR